MLGVRLLSRTNRLVTLTETGRLFLKEARRTLEQAQHAVSVARRAGRGEIGRVEVGYTADVSYSGVLSRTLRRYRRQVPDVELGLHELHSSTQIAQLVEGRIQIGFLASFIGSSAWKLPEDLDSVRLMEWPLRVALPIDHPLAQRSRIPREALADEPFILYVGSDVAQDRAWIQMILGYAPRVAYDVCSAFSILSLVGAGLGVAIVPSSVSSISAGEQIVYRPMIGNIIEFGTDVVFRRDGQDPTVTNFLQIVRADNA